ncbi:hypothetical protein [Novosphingobium sp.]|nr:hypothetical protein [Novosphingobium sp.]
MTQSNTFSTKATAAVSALALTFLLITGTVATPTAPQAAAAYIGVVA